MEHSDGIRAVSALTLLGMSHAGAQIVAVDEPETHLHLSAQRAVARSLLARPGQRILVTHSPFVVGEANPLDIVAFRADRQVRQLPSTAPIATYESLVRHWSPRLIEPLTSRSVIVIEGPSDRILVNRVAQLIGIDLDRLGIALFDLDGAKSFSSAYELFGPGGFDIKLTGLVDEDARHKWAADVEVDPHDLEAAGYFVCDPDLEGVYIDALGVADVITMLLGSPKITEKSITKGCNASDLENISRDQLWTYCKSHKVSAALAVAASITSVQAATLTPIASLLELTT